MINPRIFSMTVLLLFILEGYSKSWLQDAKKQDWIVSMGYKCDFIRSNQGFWDSGVDALNSHGIGLSFEGNTRIGLRRRLYVGYGISCSYSRTPSFCFFELTDDTYSWYHEIGIVSLRYADVRLPVSLGYSIWCPKMRTILSPFLGISGIARVWGRAKVSVYNNYGVATQYVNLMQTDMWHAETCNMINASCFVGIKAAVQHVAFSITFGSDVFKVFRGKDFNVHVSEMDVSVGYRF